MSELDLSVLQLKIAMQNPSAVTRYEASRVATHPAWHNKTNIYKTAHKGAKNVQA